MNIVDNNVGLPRDVINNLSVCQIIGNKEILIEHIEKILFLSLEEIFIQGKKSKIKILGNSLNITYFNTQTIIICGEINEIIFV